MTNPNKAGAAGQAAALANVPEAAAALAAAGAVPTPAELLPMLAGWMQQSGFDQDHPWQRSIAECLEAHTRHVQADLTGHFAATLAGSVADDAAGLLELIDAQDAMPNRMVMRATVAHIGWLADVISLHFCQVEARGGAEEWLLEGHTADALRGVRGAA